MFRLLATQIGTPTLPPIRRQMKTRNILNSPSSKTEKTPIKGTTKRKENLPPPPIVLYFPGTSSKSKKKEKNSPAAKKNRVNGKCVKCNLIWESKADTAFRNKYGLRKTT